MEKKEQKKRIAANTLYTMGGLIFMNGVLQLIVTPLLNRYMGAKQLGELLYITGLVAIICPSIGQALNTSRLVVEVFVRILRMADQMHKAETKLTAAVRNTDEV